MADFKELKDYGKLRETGGYSLRARLVDANGKKTPYIDVREHVESPSYTGFTKRGIVLGFEEAKKLLVMLPQMIDDIDEYHTPEEYKDKEESHA